MRGSRWHIWDEQAQEYLLEGAPASAPPEAVEITLTHSEAIDPGGIYRIRQIPAQADRDPREIEVEGRRLLQMLLSPNALPARFVGPPARVPVLDVLNDRTEVVWADLAELRRLLDDGFILLDPRGYATGYGKFARHARAGRAWSGWRRGAEGKVRAEREAAGSSPGRSAPEVESAEPTLEEAPPPPSSLKRRSPWRKPREASS